MLPPVHDLFGEIPVTTAEVRSWLIEVAGIDPDTPQAHHYVRAYNVPQKIALAKERGENAPWKSAQRANARRP